MQTSATTADSPRPALPTQLASPPVVGHQPATMCQICQTLHKWLSSRPQFSFPYLESKIPRNGIYLLFEDGEQGHGTSRIVRVGTHNGNDQLRSRLNQHFLKEQKDRSIFRKNIGRCLLNRDNDPFLASWELDLTARAAKTKHRPTVDFAKQKNIEGQISVYIRSHFRFVVLEIADKAKRLELESKIISTVSLCTECGPSAAWLGNHSPKPKIQTSGLWQVNELCKVPLSVAELGDLLQTP